WHFGRGRILEARTVELAGRPARRFAVESPEGMEEGIALIDAGEGRIVVVLWDCPTERAAAFRPWFEASLASLEIRPIAGGGGPRDYLGAAPGGAPGRRATNGALGRRRGPWGGAAMRRIVLLLVAL